MHGTPVENVHLYIACGPRSNVFWHLLTPTPILVPPTRRALKHKRLKCDQTFIFNTVYAGALQSVAILKKKIILLVLFKHGLTRFSTVTLKYDIYRYNPSRLIMKKLFYLHYVHRPTQQEPMMITASTSDRWVLQQPIKAANALLWW